MTRTAELAATLVPAPPAPARPSLPRLSMVELRKLVDTRAGWWLVIAILAACVVVVAVQLAVLDPPAQRLETFFLATLIPIGLLLPVLGILTVTSEWSQRTTLTTFTLVPQRWRVLAAKLVAGAIAAVASVGASLLVAAGANLGALAAGGDGTWRLAAGTLGTAVVLQLINVAMGLAFGMLLLNSPLAIVAYFVVPTIFSVLGGMVSWLADAARWLDFTLTMGPALEGETLTAQQWAQLGTTAAVWVLLPMVVGAVRVLRSEAT